MGMTLAEFAAAHPELQSYRETDPAPAGKTVEEVEAERKQIADMMKSIREQLDRGGAPEYPLHSAIDVITKLTGDEEWGAACKASIAALYGDLSQESALTDEVALGVGKFVELREKYVTRWEKQLVTQYKAMQKLSGTIVMALRTIDQIKAVAGEDPAAMQVFDTPDTYIPGRYDDESEKA